MEDQITIRRKKVYGCLSKVFCLRCFNCCKADDNSILTSSTRKELSQRLIVKYSNQLTLVFYNLTQNEEEISSLDVLILLYALQEKEIAYQYLNKCQLSPARQNELRNDLEFYVPQLLNYLVFHEEMLNVNFNFIQDQLSQFILKACINNIHFAHLVHWTLHSISAVILNNQVTEFQKVKAYLSNLVNRMILNYEEQQKIIVIDEQIEETIHRYGTAYFDSSYLKNLVLPEHICAKKYVSDRLETPEYLSCINFWQDIIEISERLKFADPKIISLRADLCKMNEQLPARVYVPFVNGMLSLYQARNSIILNIVVPETRIFSTKERAPFYICLEIYNLQEHVHIQRTSLTIEMERSILPEMQGSQGVTVNTLNETDPVTVSECYEVEMTCKDEVKSPARPLNALDPKVLSKEIFGEDSQEQSERIRRQSPFGHFTSWRLIHLIVKTGDNLKQEQFALQLIDQFKQIFILEGLPLKLTTYEIQSLGPSSGIMEMVKDATTIDSLKRKLSQWNLTLIDFFTIYYGDQLEQAQKNFCYSLAAYCLVCYFLQVKDRHNGNILLHKSGKILHIDFGFFLSIAPGKGLEFEKNVPFKLMSENIALLGGTDSEMFNLFRRLFFKGFQACQKHQDKILLLVKMMYSGHGYTLPCFSKGEQMIADLESRFNPKTLNDGELSVFTSSLINQSLDNWRAQWYDKFQYYFQGIFY